MENAIVEKLRKLIAHEKSARTIGNIHEAEAFAAKIQNLLTSHKLSLSEVDFQEREDGEPIDWEKVDVTDVDAPGAKLKVWWRVQIARAIAKLNGCMVVNNTSSKGRSFFFVGRTSDRELAKILYVYLIELGEEICAKDASNARDIQSLKFNVRNNISSFDVPRWAKAAFAAWMKNYRESWKTGFSDSVTKRMLEQYEATLKTQTQNSVAMVHINRDAIAVKSFLQGKVRPSRGKLVFNTGNADGFARGQKTGNAVNLSPNRFNGGQTGARLILA